MEQPQCRNQKVLLIGQQNIGKSKLRASLANDFSKNPNLSVNDISQHNSCEFTLKRIKTFRKSELLDDKETSFHKHKSAQTPRSGKNLKDPKQSPISATLFLWETRTVSEKDPLTIRMCTQSQAFVFMYDQQDVDSFNLLRESQKTVVEFAQPNALFVVLRLSNNRFQDQEVTLLGDRNVTHEEIIQVNPESESKPIKNRKEPVQEILQDEFAVSMDASINTKIDNFNPQQIKDLFERITLELNVRKKQDIKQGRRFTISRMSHSSLENSTPKIDGEDGKNFMVRPNQMKAQQNGQCCNRKRGPQQQSKCR